MQTDRDCAAIGNIAAFPVRMDAADSTLAIGFATIGRAAQLAGFVVKRSPVILVQASIGTSPIIQVDIQRELIEWVLVAPLHGWPRWDDCAATRVERHW